MRSVYFCLLELLTWDLHLVPSPVSIRSFGYQITNPCGETRQIWPVFLYISLGTIHRQLLIWPLPWLTISPMTFPISSICAFMISALKRRNWNGWAVSCRHISIVHYPRKLASRCVSLDGPKFFAAVLLHADKHPFFCKWGARSTHRTLRYVIAWYHKKFTFFKWNRWSCLSLAMGSPYQVNWF